MAFPVISLFVWLILITPGSLNYTKRHLQAKLSAYQLGAIPRREMLAAYNDVPSSIECSYYCLESDGCLSFFHCPNNGLCVLCKLNLLPQTANFWRTLEGAQFYTAVTSRLSFIWFSLTLAFHWLHGCVGCLFCWLVC